MLTVKRFMEEVDNAERCLDYAKEHHSRAALDSFLYDLGCASTLWSILQDNDDPLYIEWLVGFVRDNGYLEKWHGLCDARNSGEYKNIW